MPYVGRTRRGRDPHRLAQALNAANNAKPHANTRPPAQPPLGGAGSKHQQPSTAWGTPAMPGGVSRYSPLADSERAKPAPALRFSTGPGGESSTDCATVPQLRSILSSVLPCDWDLVLSLGS